MLPWVKVINNIETLEDLILDTHLVNEMESFSQYPAFSGRSFINFYTPTFKSYQTSEITSCGKNSWPAVSITGGDCKLQCDHCKAKILEPMISAKTPGKLWATVNKIVEDGGQGMLLTGGSNHLNQVEYDDYYPIIRRIKDEFPAFKIAMHTALVNNDIAQCMEQSGIDAAMMDVIGSQDTITQVYHLRRSVEDFEATLESLVATKIKVVPHIVIGLHYGLLLGEWNALEIIRRHLPDAVVLVVVMPFYAPDNRPFETPEAHAVGRFFLDARSILEGTPLLLGCARPAGLVKTQIDSYAVMAGLNGIAHPADGMVELAARLGRNIKITPACCSIAVGEEVMALDDTHNVFGIDISAIIQEERRHRKMVSLASKGIQGIQIVSQDKLNSVSSVCRR